MSLFQTATLFFILYAGMLIWNVVENSYQHYTILFNTFVLSQFFNQFNARKVHTGKSIRTTSSNLRILTFVLLCCFLFVAEFWVFGNLLTNYNFAVIQFVILLGQVLIIQFTRNFTQTYPLDVVQWFSCIGMAFLTIPLGFLIRLIPVPKTKVELRPNPNYPEEDQVSRSPEISKA